MSMVKKSSCPTLHRCTQISAYDSEPGTYSELFVEESLKYFIFPFPKVGIRINLKT